MVTDDLNLINEAGEKALRLDGHCAKCHIALNYTIPLSKLEANCPLPSPSTIAGITELSKADSDFLQSMRVCILPSEEQ